MWNEIKIKQQAREIRMCFFRKKKTLANKNVYDRNLIENNYKSMETLIVLSTDQTFTLSLKKVQEELKYLTPSVSDKVCGYDKKIKDCIEDLKIVLTKDGNVQDNAKAKRLVQDIKVLIAERNAII